MEEGTLILEGLPDDLDSVKSKIELYFKNKRKSGGQITQIREHPEDKRKAILVYLNGEDVKKVLEKGEHKIDFKSQGTVALTVKQPEEISNKKAKPPTLPKPKREKIALLKQSPSASASQCTKVSPVTEIATAGLQEEEEDSGISDLLITTQESTDKETLQMYFEQFTEMFELTKHGKNNWILRVNNQSDLQKILAQKEHDYGISLKPYKGSLEEMLDPHRFILTGFDESTQYKKISLFIGSCTQKAEHTWEILDEERIVVTFKQDIDVKSFIQKCSTKKFQGNDIEVARMELTDSVLVQGDIGQISEDALTLYFSNKKRSRGGEIKSLYPINRQKSVVVTFEDCHAAHEVVGQKHSFCGTDVQTSLFYSNLQKALMGEHPNLTDISTKINISVNEDLLHFIEKNEQCGKKLQSDAKLLHAKVVFDNTTTASAITLEMDVDRESFAALQIGPTWESKTKREVQSFLNKYDTAELSVEKDVWTRIKINCTNLIKPDSDIFFRELKSKIVIVGVKEVVSVLSDKVRKLLKEASAEVEIERNTIDTDVQLDCREKFDLIKERVQSKLANLGVTFSSDEQQYKFHLRGLKDKVNLAKAVINQTQENIVQLKLKLSFHLIEFFRSLDFKKFEQDYFSPIQIMAKFETCKDSIVIFVEKENQKRTEAKVHKILKEEVIKLSPEQAGENLLTFLRTLQDEVDKSHNSGNIKIKPLNMQIVLCGFSSVVADVAGKVKGYLEKKTQTTEDVPVKSVREVEFVDSCINLSEIPEIKKHGTTILACRSSNSPCLKVTAAKDNIKAAVDVINQQLSSIVVETHKYCKAGQAKVLEKHEANAKAKAKEFHCNLYMSQEQGSKPRLLKSYSHKIGSIMTLTITEGDLHLFTADALTCPMNGNLDFNNPISKQFLQFGGDKIAEVCNKQQKEKQALLPGDVVLSDAGQLNTMTLIYSVLPQKGQSLDTRYLQLAITNSIQKAEGQDCTSIAIPALGCKTFGFSVNESCTALREAILQFCSNNQNTPKNMRNIFVVDSDEKTVEEYNALITKQGFPDTLNHPIHPSKYLKIPLQSLKIKHESDTKVLINGVMTCLKKGDITKENVDIIVNSNNKQLDLDTGVSGAILKAAGKSVVDECAKFGPLQPGGVVMTSAGSLKCKNIAQMVGPDNAADITSSLEKVLNLCEGQKAATVAIPAIGTGRGGIGSKKSINAILKAVKNHSAQLNPTCLKEITVVAFEQKIFDAYRDYFKEWNKPSIPVQSVYGKMPENQVKIGSVRIELKKGDITNETVRGIVNTTNRDMNLKGGVSGAIFKAAGTTVEQECQKHGPLQGDIPAMTSGGNMHCDVIFHMVGPHSVAEARSRVKKVLERCDEKKITTVSFPAVGTGGGGVKNVDAVAAMFDGFNDHLSQQTSTEIKLIYVVIDRDNVLQEFKQGLKAWTGKTQGNADQDDDDDDDDDDDEMEYSSCEESASSDQDTDGSGNPIEAMIGPIKVKVLCGDITKQTVDAIVNSTTTSLDLNTGVSGAILKAAGQSVENECKTKAPQPTDGVVLTKAGNLTNIKNIVHMVGQTSEKGITNSMYKVLKTCEENKIQSVSFPALGTGAGNLGATQVANAMTEALKVFVKDFPKHLKCVNIVIFQNKMLPDFQDAIKKSKKISLNVSMRSQQQPTSSTFIKGPKPPAFCLAIETAAISYPVMTVEIYGTSNANIAKVKKFLDDLLSEECLSKDLQSNHLANLTETDKKAIVALSQTNQVSILVAGLDKLILSGKKDDVLDAVLKINNFIQNARDREIREGEVKRLKETLCWKVAKGDKWQSLDPSVSYDIELAFHRKEKSYQYQEKGETYTVNFGEMKVTNSKRESCKIKRTLHGDSDTAIIHTPATWTNMDGKDLELITLKSDSPEYKKVAKEFLDSSKHPDVSPVEVVQIDRIQSQSQWQRYSVLKQGVDKKYPKKENEKCLYHGTTKEICQKINKNGFNRVFCGRNAVVHGEGTYFAKDAWYSCQDNYSNPDDKGLKYIYRTKVVTGSPCKSKHGMKEPDPLNPQDPRAGLHDCAVDSLQNPFIFVIFCDAGAYPEYLITFKTI